MLILANIAVFDLSRPLWQSISTASDTNNPFESQVSSSERLIKWEKQSFGESAWKHASAQVRSNVNSCTTILGGELLNTTKDESMRNM